MFGACLHAPARLIILDLSHVSPLRLPDSVEHYLFCKVPADRWGKGLGLRMRPAGGDGSRQSGAVHAQKPFQLLRHRSTPLNTRFDPEAVIAA